ncbi:hypothetical protein BDV93DRAFT_522653 [Ceratobasidium sp. AG-I]|nr:hypothetical protein BDV93DRAFT_522653 [Ceratobasidium sp. AG-I]
MFSNTIVALYALALAGAAAAQAGGFTVATPASVVQCQPASLSWSGGTAPYFPSIIPGSQPGAAALKEFPSTSSTSQVWTVDLAQGTSITIQVRDSSGALQYSSAITIQNSSDASCVNASVSGTGAAGSSAPVTSDAAATSAPAATTAPAASSAAGSSSTRAASSASASVSRSASATSASASASAAANNAASAVTKGAFGVAALAGLIGAALF